MPLAPTLLTLLSRTAVADPGAFQVELDPADDPRNPLDYIASNALTSVAFGERCFFFFFSFSFAIACMVCGVAV